MLPKVYFNQYFLSNQNSDDAPSEKDTITSVSIVNTQDGLVVFNRSRCDERNTESVLVDVNRTRTRGEERTRGKD